MIEINRLDAAAGDRQAAADLLPLVYDELRKLAAARMAAEAPGHTLDATALVHEAYLRLVGDQQFDGRGHFFAAAAEAMRRILVDHARRPQPAEAGRRAATGRPRPAHRPGRRPRRRPPRAGRRPRPARRRVDPTAAELVKLRFFAGLTARARRPTPWASPRRTADRHWTFARAWLAAALAGG